MSIVWQCPDEVIEIMEQIKAQTHPHLEKAKIAMCFSDMKPFIKGRFNFGKTSKFTKLAKVLQEKQYDFLIVIPVDAWQDLLDNNQRQALIDLHLTRCTVEYEPVVEIVGNKKKPVKDEYGRGSFTDVIKVDAEGNPKWVLDPLDLHAFSQNASRYGAWCADIENVKDSIDGYEGHNDVPAGAIHDAVDYTTYSIED